MPGMTQPDLGTKLDLDAAERFLAGHARVLDRRRFERLFRGGDAQPVTDALAAYRTADGAFGYGLEPDGRSPGGQPLAIVTALGILREAGIAADDWVRGVCDWLAAHAPEEGGAPWVTPGVTDWPHAPWWAPQPEQPGSPTGTGQLLGELAGAGVKHPWITSATTFMWRHVDDVDPSSDVDTSSPAFGYHMLGLARFLDTAVDVERADAAIDRLAAALRAAVAADPESDAGLSPLWFAPEPDSRLRRVFGARPIEAHLRHLAGGQHADGGWAQDWYVWSEVAATEWRGVLTVQALHTLRTHDRLP